MIVTIVYGLICLLSGEISVDMNILTATAIIDCVSILGQSIIKTCGKK